MKESCYHCGDECSVDQTQFDDKSFCCQGCKTVYSILKENDLCTYYDLEQTPGISFKSTFLNQEKFDYLENSEVVDKLVNYRDDDSIKATFYLPQIHCKSCIWLIEKLYILEDAVTQSRVDFIKKEVYLTFNHTQKSFRQIVELLASLGYEPVIRLSDGDRQNQTRWDKGLLVRLGISGFCFGNIMMLSFPEYLPGGFDLESNYAELFNYMSLLFAIPILWIGGKDYFNSAYQGLKRNIVNLDVPISIGIITLFISSSIDVLVNHHAGYFDSLAGLIFFLLLGKVFQQQTYYQFSFDRDFRSYFPIAIRRIVREEVEVTPLEKLEVEDVVHVRNGEIIPADAQLISKKGQVDYSFVTGEAKAIDVLQEEKLFAGGKVVGASMQALVKKLPSKSYLTSLWNQDEFNKNETDGLESLSDRVSKYFTVVIFSIAILSLVYWSMESLEQGVKVFTSILIIACPCALALAVPFTYGNTMRLWGKWNYFFKNAQVVEQLYGIKTIVFDKTGTLTTVNSQEVSYQGELLTETEKSFIKSLASNSNHPLSQSLVKFFEEKELVAIDGVEEVAGSGLSAFSQGVKLKLGSARFTGATNELGTRVYVRFNDQIKGSFSISQQYRDGVVDLVKSLQKDYSLVVLSGDNDSEQAYLETVFGQETTFWFNQSPFDKLEKIRTLQKNGDVLMLGDGLNDAGALKAATVGVSVTENTAQFTPSSDVIIKGEELMRLGQLLAFGKFSRKVVIFNFVVSFSYNVVGLTFAVMGWLSPIIAAVLMPLSSITVVISAVVLTNLYALKKVYVNS